MDTMQVDEEEISFPFPQLPFEMNMHILLHLDLQSLVRTRRVNRSFALFSKSYLGRGFICKLNWPTPSGRASHTAIRVDDSMFIYGGDEGSANISHPNNHLIRFNLQTHQHQQLKFPGLPTMTEHTCVVYKNCLFMFGGFVSVESDTRPSYSNMIFMIRIGADEKAKGAMERVFVDGPVPLRRSAHSAVVVGNAMYVYGGWAGRDDSTLNDFWAFHFDTLRWEQLPNKVVPPMRAHSCTAHGNDIYIFGGYCNGVPANSFNVLYQFNTISRQWCVVKTTGDVPSGRSRCSLVSANDSLYLLGGWDRITTKPDFYQFHIASGIWDRIKLRDDHGVIKGGIQHHSCIVYNNFLLIYGGTITTKQLSTELNTDIFVLPI